MTIDLQKRKQRRKQILFTCLGLSLALHVVGFLYVYKNPLHLFSFQKESNKSTLVNSEEEALAQGEKTKALDELFAEMNQEPSALSLEEDFAFNENLLIPHSETSSETLLTTPSTLSALPPEKAVTSESGSNEIPQLALLSFDLPKAPEKAPAPSPTLTFSADAIPEGAPTSNSETLSALPQITPLAEGAPVPVTAPTQKEFAASLPDETLPLGKGEPAREKVPLALFKSFQKPLRERARTAQRSGIAPLESYALPNVPTHHMDGVFDVAVQVADDPSGEGYFFALSLSPRKEMKRGLNQTFYFIIDRSNSISKQRMEVFKKAVSRSLPYLQKGDLFNILFIDRKIQRFSSKDLPFTEANLKKAEAFLAKQQEGRLFAAAEIYSHLDDLFPANFDKERIYSLFLLTDGNTLLSEKEQRKLFAKWTQKNHGKVSMYTAAAGGDNNLFLLDLLSSCNQGTILFSQTHAGFPRKVAHMVYLMRAPLLKDLNLQATAADPEHPITLLPLSHLAPALYANIPYHICGHCDTLDDFVLYLDGYTKGEWITIKQPISFSKAKKAPKAVEKKWQRQEAFLGYDLFLKKGRKSDLAPAKAFVDAHGLEETLR